MRDAQRRHPVRFYDSTRPSALLSRDQASSERSLPPEKKRFELYHERNKPVGAHREPRRSAAAGRTMLSSRPLRWLSPPPPRASQWPMAASRLLILTSKELTEFALKPSRLNRRSSSAHLRPPSKYIRPRRPSLRALRVPQELRTHRPDLITTRSEVEVLELRRDPNLSREITARLPRGTLKYCEDVAWRSRRHPLPGPFRWVCGRSCDPFSAGASRCCVNYG